MFQVGDVVSVTKILRTLVKTPRHLIPTRDRLKYITHEGIVFRARGDNRLVEVRFLVDVQNFIGIASFFGDELELIYRPSLEELLTTNYTHVREYWADRTVCT